MPAQSGAGKVVRGQATLLVSSLGQLAISIVTVAVVGRWLAPADFALFGLIGVIFSIARDLLDLGSTGVATRLAARNPGASAQIIGATMVWRGCLALIAVVAIALASLRLAAADERLIVLCTGLALSTSVAGAFNALFTARHQQTWPAIASIGVQGGALVVLLMLKASGAGGHAAAWLLVGREVIWWIVVAAMGVTLLGGVPKLPRNADDMKPVVLPGLVFGLAVLLHQLIVQGDVPLARWVIGEGAAAAVAASARPIGAMVALPWIAAAPLIAAITSLMKRETSEAAQLARAAIPLGLLAGLGVATLGAACGKAILFVLYGKQYAGDPAAVVACRAYCIVLGGAVAAAAPTMAIVAVHRERALLGLSMLCFVVATVCKGVAASRGDIGTLTMITAGAEWCLAAGACVICGRSIGLAALSAGAAVLLGGVALVTWGVAAARVSEGARLGIGLACGAAYLIGVSRTREAGVYRRMCLSAGESEEVVP